MKKKTLLTLFTVHCLLFTGFAQTSQPILRMNTEMHTGIIRHISADTGGKFILTSSRDKTAKLWDATNGTLIRTFRPPIGLGLLGMVQGCALSPDGKIAVIGVFGNKAGNHNIYFFNTITGEIVQRIAGLESNIIDLKFSLDGEYLAAALGENKGVRIYKWSDTSTRFDSLSKLDGYGSSQKSICFDNSGRLATVCYDGYLRLYDNKFNKLKEIKTAGGLQPLNLAFSPDGRKIAVGYYDSPTVEVYDGKTLGYLYKPDVSGTDSNSSFIYTLSFSADGKYLFGGGNYYLENKGSLDWAQIRKWENGGEGSFTDFIASHGSIFGILPMSDNSIIFCSGTPDFGRIKPNGISIFFKPAETNIYASFNTTTFKINREGDEINFRPVNNSALYFSLKNKQFTTDTTGRANMKIYTDHLDTIYISDWYLSHAPKLNGKPMIFLLSNERSTSVDISTDKSSIVLGTDWNIYCFDAKGEKKWGTATLAMVRQVNISGDNRLVAAALSDGSIRWYRISDGSVLLTFFPHPDNKRWILYTANGYYVASESGDELIGWHINNGEDNAASFYPAKNYADRFFRPDIVSEVLKSCQTDLEIIKKKGEEKTDISRKPPLVRIISPANNAVMNQSQVTVTVDVTDQGGGIDEILLYVNGKVVETTKRGIKLVAESGSENARTFTITLTGGENRIRTTAFNTSRTEAIPDEIKVTYSGAKSTANLYLFVIGINEYKKPTYRLNYAVADATSIKDEMSKGTKDIFGRSEVLFMQDAGVTRKSLLEKFDEMKSKVRPEDVFVFYYAGHGVMSEDQHPQFYIVPVDVTQLVNTDAEMQKVAISSGELQTFSRELKAQKQFFIFDACQSGGLVEALASRGATEERAIAQLARSTGTYWITASGSQQFATEFVKLSHGLFTYTILQGLQGEADGNSDKKITVEELSAYVKNKLPEFSEKYKGEAQYPNSYGYGMDFPIFILK